MRFPVALLPRSLPDRCSTFLAANGFCTVPCNWVREHPTACGRYCDGQIQSGLRSHCPLLEYFELCPGDDSDTTLFPVHVLKQNVVNGEVADRIGGKIQPVPIDYTYWRDRRLLEEILPHRQPHEREGDYITSLVNLQVELNTYAAEYTRELRSSGTPPPNYDSGFRVIRGE